MSLVLEPEIGVPYSDEIPYMDLLARAKAASNTASMMEEHGLEVEPTSEDEEIAAKIVFLSIFETEAHTKNERVQIFAWKHGIGHGTIPSEEPPEHKHTLFSNTLISCINLSQLNLKCSYLR